MDNVLKTIPKQQFQRHIVFNAELEKLILSNAMNYARGESVIYLKLRSSSGTSRSFTFIVIGCNKRNLCSNL